MGVSVRTTRNTSVYFPWTVAILVLLFWVPFYYMAVITWWMIKWSSIGIWWMAKGTYLVGIHYPIKGAGWLFVRIKARRLPGATS